MEEVSFQVKDTGDTIGAMTQGQLQELARYLQANYCLYLGTVPQAVDTVHRAAMRGENRTDLVINALNLGLRQQDAYAGMYKVEEQTPPPLPGSSTVILNGFATTKKISVIKTLRELTGLGLYDAKMAVENLPYLVAKHIPMHMAEQARTKLLEAGATAVSIH